MGLKYAVHDGYSSPELELSFLGGRRFCCFAVIRLWSSRPARRSDARHRVRQPSCHRVAALDRAAQEALKLHRFVRRPVSHAPSRKSQPPMRLLARILACLPRQAMITEPVPGRRRSRSAGRGWRLPGGRRHPAWWRFLGLRRPGRAPAGNWPPNRGRYYHGVPAAILALVDLAGLAVNDPPATGAAGETGKGTRFETTTSLASGFSRLIAAGLYRSSRLIMSTTAFV
jgi:hypothetical protein